VKLFQFNIYYFLWAIVIFTLEVTIALYFHDDFIRPYFGDFLVVILFYAAIKSVLPSSILQAASIALLICYLLEITQYLNLLAILGLQKSRPIAIILGSSFSWSDMLTYTLGFIFIIGIEKLVPQAN
jgi:hypothetical protein